MLLLQPTLNGRVRVLLSTRGINRVHLRELALEGDVGEDTACNCLVVRKNDYTEACQRQDGSVQLRAAKAPVALHGGYTSMYLKAE